MGSHKGNYDLTKLSWKFENLFIFCKTICASFVVVDVVLLLSFSSSPTSFLLLFLLLHLLLNFFFFFFFFFQFSIVFCMYLAGPPHTFDCFKPQSSTTILHIDYGRPSPRFPISVSLLLFLFFFFLFPLSFLRFPLDCCLTFDYVKAYSTHRNESIILSSLDLNDPLDFSLLVLLSDYTSNP